MVGNGDLVLKSNWFTLWRSGRQFGSNCSSSATYRNRSAESCTFWNVWVVLLSSHQPWVKKWRNLVYCSISKLKKASCSFKVLLNIVVSIKSDFLACMSKKWLMTIFKDYFIALSENSLYSFLFQNYRSNIFDYLIINCLLTSNSHLQSHPNNNKTLTITQDVFRRCLIVHSLHFLNGCVVKVPSNFLLINISLRHQTVSTLLPNFNNLLPSLFICYA